VGPKRKEKRNHREKRELIPVGGSHVVGTTRLTTLKIQMTSQTTPAEVRFGNKMIRSKLKGRGGTEFWDESKAGAPPYIRRTWYQKKVQNKKKKKQGGVLAFYWVGVGGGLVGRRTQSTRCPQGKKRNGTKEEMCKVKIHLLKWLYLKQRKCSKMVGG